MVTVTTQRGMVQYSDTYNLFTAHYLNFYQTIYNMTCIAVAIIIQALKIYDIFLCHKSNNFTQQIKKKILLLYCQTFNVIFMSKICDVARND